MVTIPKLKVNNFKQTSIPKPADLFARFGFSKKTGDFTGDDLALDNMSKVEKIQEVEKVVVED